MGASGGKEDEDTSAEGVSGAAKRLQAAGRILVAWKLARLRGLKIFFFLNLDLQSGRRPLWIPKRDPSKKPKL